MDSKRIAYIVGAAVIGTLIFVAVYHMNNGSGWLTDAFKSNSDTATKPTEEAKSGQDSAAD